MQFVHEANRNRFHLQKDLTLTHSEFTNFQKLRFHALVAKTDDEGYWLITARGGQFLRGEVPVSKTVSTFRNKVVGHSPELIWVHAFREAVRWFEKRQDFAGPATVESKPAPLFT